MKIFSKEKHALKRISVPYSDLSQSSRFRDMSGEVSTVAVPSSGIVIGLPERTDALVRGLVFLLEHHRAPVRVTMELKRQLHDYLDTSSSEGIWLKRAKYVLTYPFAKFLRNELPPSPDAVFRPSGVLRRWMKARMNAFNRRNVHLWYSWLQAKRCALSVSDTMIAEAYEKHFKQLTAPDPCLDEESEGSELLDQIFLNPTFRKVLTQVRTGISRSYENDFSERVASTSACYESSRKDGGQFGSLNNYLADFIDFAKGGSLPYDWKDDARDRSVLQWIGGDELVRMEIRRVVRGNRTQMVMVERHERYGRYWWNMLVRARDSRLIMTPALLGATIQAVLEPLKIRIISKGPAFEYYEMKPLQKTIHSVMRTMPCFRLIGRPFSPTDMIDCVPKDLRHDDAWHSVDYSAATDGLSSEYGMRILEFILRDVSYEDRARAGKVLGPHRLHYPELKNGKWTSKGAYRGDQTNGQLMGGILSFPILCLANLGVYLEVRRRSGRLTDSSLREVLVNGDDMLYVGTQDEWQSHVVVGKGVGLEMSVGKAYRHTAYANANSTCFVMDLQKVWNESLFGEARMHPYQINFLNVGLVFGQHKVQVREAGTAESHHMTSGCVPNIPVILDGCLPGRQSEVLRYILIKRRNEVREDSKAIVIQGRRRYEVCRNLFLPCSQGGMGIVPPVDWKYRVKKIDRRIAASLIGEEPRSEHPLPGFPVESATDPIPPWIRKEPEPTIPEIRLCQRRIRSISPVPVVPYWFSRGVVQL